MSIQEFEFLLGKMCTSIGVTLSVKKQLLNDLAEIAKPKLIPDKEFITEEEFITIMLGAFRDFNQRLNYFNERINIFNACVRKDRLPAHLMPGGNLLGKFKIDEVLSYSDIIKNNLRENSSVFIKDP